MTTRKFFDMPNNTLKKTLKVVLHLVEDEL